jgi:hypothetical protein
LHAPALGAHLPIQHTGVGLRAIPCRGICRYVTPVDFFTAEIAANRAMAIRKCTLRLNRFVGLVLTVLCATSGADNQLTDLESKWLTAADPVLTFAANNGLTVDVVVQSRPVAGDVPFAVGVHQGRCKLLLSMRERADAEAILVGVPEAEHALLIEAMTAHEVAHCWRYAHGTWQKVPAGFAASEGRDVAANSPQQMALTRREEAYADLVALAWTRLQHPNDYQHVHNWLAAVRAEQPVDGGYHDTRNWLQLAGADRFGTGSIFEQAQTLWLQGLGK